MAAPGQLKNEDFPQYPYDSTGSIIKAEDSLPAPI